MKKIAKHLGLISFILAIVAFVLLMVSHGLVNNGEYVSSWYSGMAVIFGKGDACLGGFGINVVSQVEVEVAWSALLGWIFVLVAAVIYLIGFALPLLKVKALVKFSGLLNLIAAGLAIVGGVFLFLTVSTFAAAQGWSNADGWSLGVGWVIAAILAIVAGVVALIPMAADFKKK